MASIDLILRKDKTKRNGNVPVYLRILKDRKAQYISLKEAVIPELWLEDAQEVDKKHPNAKWLNAKFIKRKSGTKDMILQAEERARNVRTQELKAEVIGAPPVDFFEFGKTFLRKYDIPGKIGTYRARKAMLGKFKSYVAGKPLYFDNFSIAVLTDYIQYLRKSLKNGEATIQTNLKFLHTIFNQAIKENIVTLNENPFLKVRVKAETSRREYLTIEEIEAIKKLDIDSSAKIFHHRNMFLFSCFGGGLGIREVLMLKWGDIRDERLYFQRKKTGHLNSFPLTEQGKEIINYYRKQNKSARGSHFVFPAMSNTKDYSDPNYLHNVISSQTTLMNKSLKTMQEKAGLSKRLSTHLARHTFATAALMKGIPIDQVQSILGHSNIRETMIYAKTLNKGIDDSMKKFRF